MQARNDEHAHGALNGTEPVNISDPPYIQHGLTSFHRADGTIIERSFSHLPVSHSARDPVLSQYSSYLNSPYRNFLPSKLVSNNHHPKSLRFCDKANDFYRYDDPDHIFEELWQEPRDVYGKDSTILYPTSSALPISRWTSVSTDDKLLNHLLLLFWTWDTTANRVVDRTLFEDGLKFLDPSDQRGLQFCSPFLVNALLALACVSMPHWR